LKPLGNSLSWKFIKEVAKEYGISESTLRRDYKKVLDNVEHVIPKGPIDALKKNCADYGQDYSTGD
jgi:hypothetical protein